MKWPEILGCIAGDDTIMCVVKTSEQAPGVVQKLGGILSRGK
jgi:transcriptional regulator of arginine metabolism